MTKLILGEVLNPEWTSTRAFVAYLHQAPIAVLTVCPTIQDVQLVYVMERFQRRGIATGLLAAARESTGWPLDMDSGDRTPEGKAWAKAVGIRCQGRVRGYSAREAKGKGAGCLAAIALSAHEVEVIGEMEVDL